MSTKHRSTLPYGSNPMKPTKKEKGSFRKKIEARAAERAQAKPAAATGIQVEATRVGRSERVTSIRFVFTRTDGARDLKAERGLDAFGFRLAARLTEETPEREMWAIYCQAGAGGARVTIELAQANAREEAAAWSAIERALGAAGAPAPLAPNMSRIYTVEA